MGSDCAQGQSQVGGLKAGQSASAVTWRKALVACLVSLGLSLYGIAVMEPAADAAITHEFLAPLSAALEKGVPSSATPEEAALTGPLSGVTSLTVDSGHLWVAERIEAGKNLARSRADKFDDATGAFIPPQLREEGGVKELDTAVAVGHPGGEEDVYVAAVQKEQGVLAVFGPAGALQSEGVWSGANTPNETFGAVAGVAVDASPSLETHGDVYVATSHFLGGAGVVDVFAGEAGGKEPAKVIADLAGTCETPGEALPCTGGAGHELVPFVQPTGIAVSPLNGDVLVADGEEAKCSGGLAQCVVDVFEPVAGMPGKYNFLFSIKGAPGEPFKRIGPIAVDGEGDIYVVEKLANVAEQFNAAGVYLSRLAGTADGPFKEVRSVTADAASGDVYVGDFDQALKTGVVDAFGPSLVVPDVTTGAAVATVKSVNGEGQIQAALNGTVNPLGEGEATCRFAWGTTAAFGQTAPCEPESVGEGNAPAPVTATIEGLVPDTTYTLRLQASNKNGTNPGEAADNKELATPGPGIHSQSVSTLAATSAKLNATIDPNNAPTSYYFQYGQSTAYEAQVPAPPGPSLGAGKGDVQVAPQHIQGLTPGTVYHYRVVAVSALQLEGKGAPTAVAFAGVDQTFTTQGTLASPLPDSRRWELVSPANKHGALLLAPKEAELIQAADNGSAIAYMATLPTEAGVKGYIYLGVPVLANRGATGWSSKDISLAHPGASGLPIGLGYEYRFFTSDLSQAIVEPLGEFSSLAPEVFPPDSERGPYLRHDATCASEPGSCYRPLLVGCPAEGQPCAPAVEENADVPEGTKFGGTPTEGESRFVGEARFVGASSDLSHVILSSRVALTETATDGKAQLYEYSPGHPASQQLQLLSGVASEEGDEAQLGFANASARHAVSEDGSRVVWSSKTGHHLYLSELGKGGTVQLDLSQGCEECEGEGEANAHFQLASADGTRVLFTDTQRLTQDAGRLPGTADLYECKIAAGACVLQDLTPAPGHGQAADVLGAVIGASEDGAWVYFVANGVLGDGAQLGASAGDCVVNGKIEGQGSCNLYVSHEGATHWIAELAGGDNPDWTGFSLGTRLNRLTARASPDGRWLAFMSNRSLTGYDNHDAHSGKADEEVFAYHAESPGAGSLTCASCDPSGARPVGVEYAKINGRLAGGERVWANNAWIAANVPGWTAYSQGQALHQPRYLSDSGRLFFNSNDALVAQDINSNQDAYQFEPTGVGDCSSASQTFSAASGGCVALISSGTASGESAFLDASENGDDVFFLTEERLVSEDVDTALDLYDAHVCSSGAPCFSEAEAPPPCTTAEACRAAPAPQPSIFGSPSSATFSGQGNVVSPPPPPPPKPKLTLKQQLNKALSACRKRFAKSKRRRVSCEKQARKRYGPKKAKKTTHKAKKR